MAGDNDSPSKAHQQSTQTPAPKHDRTGGPMTGRMVDQQNWALGQVKANQAERQATKQRHDRAEPNSEPSRPQQQQQQPERKTLRTFEDRHPPTLVDLKREQSGGSVPQREAAGRQPESQQGQGDRKPDHYKELKTFEKRHPGMDGRSH
jgi:hypothetical protein